jgi:glucosyl-dolichyl phosphate glucuronosyltransferase
VLITVAICTWNRSALLDQTLARMRELVIPDGVEWELLVVNNNSTDETEAVLERHAKGPLPLRALFEPTPGQSHARNRAIDVARGDLIVWTDDDVLVDPHWLARYRDASRRWPEASYFGGPIRPWFESPPPAWMDHLLTYCRHLWAVLDLGSPSRPFATAESPFGANMAIRSSVQRAHRFDTSKGHVAGGLSGGDETSLFAGLAAKGHQGIWIDDASVLHFVPAERMTMEYVASRGFQYGYQNYDPSRDRDSRTIFGVPGYIWKQYLRRRLTKLFRPFVSVRGWSIAVYQTALIRGVLQRIHDQRRERKSSD